ncbi:DUF350 domain-containing protein [Arenicella xantha]|uniref:DUF350 domain-containing protein n=1 Tax=Arenicella xantha TaxID=644221 RepID=A0A395JKC3_9GAMM|nr:DUF350 domain-containing protein [Arenicella xantha]RBP50875.1 hypothetical protein DFR28_102291 [Arenicella xantha]
MESEFFIATLFNLAINLLYTLLSLLVGVIALKFVDKQLLKNVDIERQLQSGNIAVAIFASTILLFVAIIVSFGLKG